MTDILIPTEVQVAPPFIERDRADLAPLAALAAISVDSALNLLETCVLTPTQIAQELHTARQDGPLSERQEQLASALKVVRSGILFRLPPIQPALQENRAYRNAYRRWALRPNDSDRYYHMRIIELAWHARALGIASVDAVDE